MQSKSVQIFVDTSFFKGLIDGRDDFHKEAVKIFAGMAKEDIVLITSNYILDETFTLIRKRRGRDKVKELRDFLAKAIPPIKIVRVIAGDEANAWGWFLKDWSDLSFTDCVSFAVVKRLGLDRVATFDQHFQKAGFSKC
ncbi:MAG: PIN domain-containing protein [Patescibacteria group bacterium]